MCSWHYNWVKVQTHIRFTREKPIDNWLPFLNVEVFLSNSEYKTKWYHKLNNKNILIHYLSAHPTRTKKAVIGNIFEAAKRAASGEEERSVPIRMGQKVAIFNGYTFKRYGYRGQFLRKERFPSNNDDTKVQYRLPHVSENLCRAVRSCQRQAGL